MKYTSIWATILCTPGRLTPRVRASPSLSPHYDSRNENDKMTIDNHDNFLYFPVSDWAISPCLFQFFNIWCTLLRETLAPLMAMLC